MESLASLFFEIFLPVDLLFRILMKPPLTARVTLRSRSMVCATLACLFTPSKISYASGMKRSERTYSQLAPNLNGLKKMSTEG